VKEGCKKMLLGSGTPVEQVVNRKKQEGLHDVEEQVVVALYSASELIVL
jgi:hypothetical protein